MNDETSEAFEVQSAIKQTFTDLVQQVTDHAPQIIGGILLLLAGWMIAIVLKLLTKKAVQSLNSIFLKAAKNDGAKRARIKNAFATILGGVVFWSVLAFFLAASVNLLGWQSFSVWMGSIVSFLPSLFAGLLIILAGVLIGNAARSGIVNAATNFSATRMEILARGAQAIILFSAIVIGVEQIGLNVHFLTNIVVAVIGIGLAGAALAFSLGARTMVANVIGVQHAKKHCRVGERIKFETYEGEILEMTQTSIILDTEKGRAIIPAKLFQEHVSLIGSDTEISPPSDRK